MADEELKVKITVEGGDKAKDAVDGMSKSTTGLTSVLTQLIPGASSTTRALEGMGGTVKALAPTMGVSAEAAAGLSTSLVAMAAPIAAIIAVVGVATIAITGMSKAFAFAMEEAESAQKVETQLEAQIKATGGAAGLTAEQIKEMASQMSQLTGVTDDQIIASANVLLRFTEIGKDVFPQAQQAALDLSAAMGTDLSSASLMLGKALQDPEQGLTALRRAGIMFDDSMIQAMQRMVESGNQARAQGMILAEVSNLVGGSAQAMGGTVAGESAKIKNLLSEMAEDFGKAFLPLKGDLLVIVREFLTAISGSLQPAMALLRNELKTLQIALRDPETKAALKELIAAFAAWIGAGAVNDVKMIATAVRELFRNFSSGGPEMIRTISLIVNDMARLAMIVGRVLDLFDRLSGKRAAMPASGSMPGYASGVMNAPGGWAMVGESGPELMQVPRGANIYPSGSAPSAAVGGMKIYGPISITAPSDGSLSALMHNLEAAATATA